MLADQEQQGNTTPFPQKPKSKKLKQNPIIRYVKQIFCRYTAVKRYNLHSHDRYTAEAHEKKMHQAIWILLQWTPRSRGIRRWGMHQIQPGSIHMCCSVLELLELPKQKSQGTEHSTEVLLPTQDPSWLQQKSESIKSIKLTPYAWCCSTAFPKIYQLTCITSIFPFSAVTQLSVILTSSKIVSI